MFSIKKKNLTDWDDIVANEVHSAGLNCIELNYSVVKFLIILSF